MIWLIIAAVIMGVLCWFLFSPLVLEADTRVPAVVLRWISIGKVRVWYQDEWWWSIQVFFYRKTMRFADMKQKPRKTISSKTVIRQKKKKGTTRVLPKIIRVVRTCRLREWKLAIDTGDYIRNAQLYPLNFMPGVVDHLQINFNDENYLVLKISNRPWKMLFAFLR